MQPETPDALDILRLKWLGGVVLYALALWGVTAAAPMDMLVQACWVPVLAFLLFPRLSTLIPKFVWGIYAFALLPFVAGDFVLHRPDLVGPLLRMITLLGLLRALPPRKRREDLQLLLICFFMLLLAGVLTLSLLFAAQLVVFTPFALAGLLVITLAEPAENREDSAALWQGFRWFRFIRRVLGNLHWRFLGMGAGLYLLMLALTGVIFILLPRFRLDQSIPFLRPPAQQSLSGFSDEVHFGDIVDIIRDERVALRIDTPPGAEMPALPYWRMAVLDEYSGGGFRASLSLKESARPVTERALVFDPEAADSAEPWTFYLEGGISRYLPTPGVAAMLRFQAPLDLEVNGGTGVTALQRDSGGMVFYQYVGDPNVPAMSPARIDMGLWNTGVSIARRDSGRYPYTTLALPEGLAKQLAPIVAQISGGRRLSARQFAEASRRWLNARHQYSLASSLPEGQGDPLVRWMLSNQPGHCELFAGSQVLLLRAGGYPARLVTGFLGGNRNAFEDYFMVRNSDAHAWVEYFHGRQWFRSDPTPGNEEAQVAGSTAPTSIDDSLRAYVDSLRVLWYRRVVSFDFEQQQEIGTRIRGFTQAFMDGLEDWAAGLWAEVRSIIDSPLAIQRWISPLARLALVAALIGLWIWVRRRFPGNGRRIGRLRLDPTRRRAGRMLTQLESTPEPAPPALIDQLRTLRYGPETTWPANPTQVFREARRASRK